jgi:hypothetical protein
MAINPKDSMTITSKFDGECKLCGGRILAGESVNWTKGEKGVAHEVCPENPQPVVATDMAKAFVASLLGEAAIDDDIRDVIQIRLDSKIPMTKREASSLIDYLKGLPKAALAVTEDDVPEGRYALDIDGTVAFVKVTWRDGRVGVWDADAAFGEKGKMYPKAATLAAIIAQGAGECAARYGHLRGICGRCNARLSDLVSVELGIGPTCGRHWYDAAEWKGMKKAARSAIEARGDDPDDEVDGGVA